jgi:predicted component of type VI protein secretion system
MEQIELTKERLTIGRSDESDIILDNAGVSSHHAVIEKDGSLYIISDADSSNGVFINGNKIDRHTLKYRDEIQIYNYVLRFMPTSGLQGTPDPDIAQDEDQSQAGTMEVNMSDVQDLLKLREKKKTAYIEMLGNNDGQSRLFFEEQDLKIGKSKECDIRTSGLLFFGVAAEIQRKPDGYYIVPQPRGHVMRNGKPLVKADKLMDGDSLRVRNLSMQFFHRVVNQ